MAASFDFAPIEEPVDDPTEEPTEEPVEDTTVTDSE